MAAEAVASNGRVCRCATIDGRLGRAASSSQDRSAWYSLPAHFSSPALFSTPLSSSPYPSLPPRLFRSTWTASVERTRIRTMTQTMTVTDAKARLSELVAAVATTHDHVEITRNGEPAAVLVSVDELATLRETIALLSDPEAVAEIREAQQDIAAGRVTPAEDIREAMLARRRSAA